MPNSNTNTNTNNKYILLVDDEKDIVDLFSVYLNSNGYPTISFVNPVEALEYYNKSFTNCALVISDYSMPHMTGFDLIKNIKDKDDEIKTIIINATIKNNIQNYNDTLYRLKIDKILEKPISLDKLMDEVKMLFR